jgi:hypothetical protein
MRISLTRYCSAALCAEFPDLKLSSVPNISFFGVYDGHGGDGASSFLQEHLHRNFSLELKRQVPHKFFMAAACGFSHIMRTHNMMLFFSTIQSYAYLFCACQPGILEAI